MSGLFKGIGKVFKKVVSIVKKVALPVLAIGAVVLTGGAALGLLPGLTPMLGSLGLSSTLTGILAGAAKGALFGFGGALLTGKNPLKGATSGLLLGGALSGIGAAANGIKGAAGAAAGVADPAAAAVDAAGQTVTLPATGASITIPNAVGEAASSTIGQASGGIGATAAQAAPAIAASTGGAGGFLGWMQNNPLIAGQLISGIGAGISANAQAKQDRKTLERLGENYLGYSGLYSGTDPENPYPGKVQFDPKTGRIMQVAG